MYDVHFIFYLFASFGLKVDSKAIFNICYLSGGIINH